MLTKSHVAQSRLRRALIGAAAAATAGLVARRAKVLCRSGALAAIPVGGAVFSGTGTRGSVMLLTYVASSSLLGRLPRRQIAQQRRGTERDAVQVLANGGVPALIALAMLLVSQDRQRRLWAAFGGAVAAATADTWATEVGSWSGQEPRSILRGQFVSRGASGGVTAAGLAASVAGAGVIAAMTAAGARLQSGRGRDTPTAWAVLAAGLAGSLLDSVLGASIQEVRVCDACHRETELLVHTCGGTTRHLRGQHWCNNDVVNAFAVSFGAVTAPAIASMRAG